MTPGPSSRKWDNLEHMAQMHRVEEKLLMYGDGAVFVTWLVLLDAVAARTESWAERETGQDDFVQSCVAIVSGIVATHYPYSIEVSGQPMCNVCRGNLWPCGAIESVTRNLGL